MMIKIWKTYGEEIGFAVVLLLTVILAVLKDVSFSNAIVMIMTAAVVFILKKIKSGKAKFLSDLLMGISNIIFIFVIVNSFTGFINVLDLCKEIMLDAVLVGAIYVIIVGITGNIRVTAVIGNIMFSFLMLLNVFMKSARGRNLNYFDIDSIGTALNVAGQYQISFSFPVVLAIFLIGVYTWWSTRTCKKAPSGYLYYIGRVTGVLFGVFLFALFIGTGFLKRIGIYDRAWDYDEESILLNFIVEYRETCVAEDAASPVPCPEGYSETRAVEILNEYEKEEEKPQETVPNVIVIMNESYADLRVYGSLGDIDSELMPFYDSLDENCVKGMAYSSVFGGNTANSEYECLTGDSMILYPQGSVAYSLYLKDYEEIPTIAKLYQNQGYMTYAMHPYRENGWYRDRIYPAMGFDHILFESEYPHKDLIRGFVSDREDYEKLIETYENKTEERMFIFNITMQNHGGYNDRGWKGDIALEEIDQKSADYNKEELELYLSLMKESDKALEELIEYFDKAEEPVLILLFGDHQPGIEYAYRRGAEAETMQKYAIPFLLWANYPMESGQMDGISINYLPVLLAQRAGMPLNAYFRYLQAMYDKYPVITAEGVVDKDGNYREKNDAVLQQEIHDYEYVMYYRLTGTGSEYEDLFGY